jgi:AcrR family transcriptional regulator
VTSRTQAKTRRPNRAEKRAANRERILRAARKVFGTRGFHAATIEEIADEAGLSNGAIYYNFDSKGDLFFALLEERQVERLRSLRRMLAGATEAESRELAIAEARDATRSLKESREWRMLLFEFVPYAARSKTLAPRLREHKRRFESEMNEILAKWLQAVGATPRIPADRLALVTLALANGLAFEEVFDPGSVPDELLGDMLGLLAGGERAR